MKPKIFALLFVCICLLSFSAVYAEGAEQTETTSVKQTASDDGCNTKEELYDFLKLNEGGTITLTGDILWDYTYSDLPPITKATVIEMGTYRIRIPTECIMQIDGPVTFRGEGSVLFETAGLLNLSYGVEVLSTGEDAVAIQGAETSDMQLFICNITALGANSTAIRSALSVTVQLCHVSGTKAAIEAPEITLDASSASPELTEATIIERVPTLDRSLQLYGITLPVDVSQDQYRETISGYEKLQYAFIDPETGNAIGGPLACDWSEVPMWPAEAGSYTLTAKPTNLPDWFPVEIPSFDIPLHIVEKSKPWLNVVFADPYFGMLALQFAPNALDEEAQLTLFYSTDKGETWKNVTEDFPDSTLHIIGIDVIGLEPNTNYWFYAEVTGGDLTGCSNIIYHPNFISDTDVDFSYGGGDRDEDDFGDQGETPPSGEIIPPPDTDSSTDTTNTPPTETTNNTTGTTNDTPSDSASESTGGTTTSEPTTDTTTAPTEQPDNSEPDTSDSTEITEDKTNGTSQTENITTPSTDQTDMQPQKDVSSPHTIDIVMIILGLAVAGGIVCILLLWRKGGRK